MQSGGGGVSCGSTESIFISLVNVKEGEISIGDPVKDSAHSLGKCCWV